MKIPHFLHPTKKKAIIVTVLLIILGAGYFFFGPKKQPAPETTLVKRGDIAETVSASGNLAGKNTVNLKFKYSGRLNYLPFKVGDTVKKGQTIASLDTKDLSITLQQAQNTYRDKQAIAEKAEDDVKDHSKDETYAQRVTRTTAQATRDSAFDAVKAAQRNFEDAIIYAPFTGIITKSDVIIGQFVSAADLIAQLVDPTESYFEGDFDEADAGKIRVGQPAKITLDAYPDQIFEGIVDKIIPQTKTTSTGATVITVKLKIITPIPQFISGLSGQVDVVTTEVKNALFVPTESILNENETVNVVSGKTNEIIYKANKITPGISSDSETEIKAGLVENEIIVKNPSLLDPKLIKR